MAAGLIGRKLGMTRIFGDDGSVVPVSVIEATPNSVTRLRTPEQDGYAALQVGAGVGAGARRSRSPASSSTSTRSASRRARVREFRVDSVEGYELGQPLDVSLFEAGELVDVTGVSKGHGFTGTIARHHFKRGPKTHGSTTTASPARSAPAPPRAASSRARRWAATWATSR